MNFILVTGVNGGIGHAIYSTLTQSGYQVIGCDISSNTRNMKYFIQWDLSALSDESNFKKFSKLLSTIIKEHTLVALINNAAVQILGGINTLTIADFNKTLAVNIVAPLALTKICYPYLKNSRGSVINIGSIHSKLTKPEFIAYATSKAALEGLTKSLAVDCGDKIRVNAILPAAIETPMLKSGFGNAPDKLNALKSFHPSKSIGNPTEIAKIIDFLISDTGLFVNGATWNIDGGISHRLYDPV